jgi:hypothetical protein
MDGFEDGIMTKQMMKMNNFVELSLFKFEFELN